MIINGTVEDPAKLLTDGRVSYNIISGDERYRVSSEGLQAVKDMIFIGKGQQMTVTGDLENEILNVKESRISIQTEIRRTIK